MITFPRQGRRLKPMKLKVVKKPLEYEAKFVPTNKVGRCILRVWRSDGKVCWVDVENIASLSDMVTEAIAKAKAKRIWQDGPQNP